MMALRFSNFWDFDFDFLAMNLVALDVANEESCATCTEPL